MKTALSLVALPILVPLALALFIVGGMIVFIQILTTPPEMPL